MHEAHAAAFAVGEIQAAGDGVIDLFSRRHPGAGDEAFARQYPALGCGEYVGRIAALVLEEVPQVFVACEAEQRIAAAKAGGELEIGKKGAAMSVDLAVKPVLFLGEVVVGDAGAMQCKQRRLRRAEIGGIAVRLGDVQWHAVDPAAHQDVASGKKKRRRNAERAGNGKRAAFAAEKREGQRTAPPRHAVEPSQHRGDFAGLGAKAAALDRRKYVALEHDAGLPAAAEFGRDVVHARF